MQEGRVRAFCRLLPTAVAATSALHVVGGGGAIEVRRPDRGLAADGAAARPEGEVFQVDGVLEGTSQEAVYNTTTAPLVQSALQGTSATVLSCGAAKSGRSYTLFGGGDYPSRGLVHRALSSLYAHIEAAKAVTQYQVQLSFLSLAGDEVGDLLASGGGASGDKTAVPSVALDGKGKVQLRHVTQRPCSSEVEALDALLTGLRRSPSALAHRIVIVTLESRSLSADDPERRYARLHFVDLAGPCRAVNVGRQERLLARATNRSLSALEQVVLALGSGNPNGYIPFRESRLTMLLKGSVGGECLTTVVAHLHSGDAAIADALSTLKFVMRIRRVPVTPVVNVAWDAQVQVQQLQRQVAELQAELRLQQQLRHSGDGGSAPPALMDVEERQGLQEKVASFLDGSAATVRVVTVREMHTAFCLLRDEVERRDEKVAALQQEVRTLRAAPPPHPLPDQTPVKGKGKGGKRHGAAPATSVVPVLIGDGVDLTALSAGFAPSVLAEPGGRAYGTAKHPSASPPPAGLAPKAAAVPAPTTPLAHTPTAAAQVAQVATPPTQPFTPVQPTFAMTPTVAAPSAPQSPRPLVKFARPRPSTAGTGGRTPPSPIPTAVTPSSPSLPDMEDEAAAFERYKLTPAASRELREIQDAKARAALLGAQAEEERRAQLPDAPRTRTQQQRLLEQIVRRQRNFLESFERWRAPHGATITRAGAASAGPSTRLRTGVAAMYSAERVPATACNERLSPMEDAGSAAYARARLLVEGRARSTSAARAIH